MLKLLIVDDEALEREGLQFIISRAMPDECEFFHAAGARQAIELCDSVSPDIGFVDMKMPGMSGLDAIREIKRRHPEMRIVIITAYDDFDYAKEAIGLGVKEYLLKPAKRETIVDLLHKLRSEIEQQRMERERQLQSLDQISMLIPAAETELALYLMNGHLPAFMPDPLFELLAPRFRSGYAVTCVLPFHHELHDRRFRQKCVDRLVHVAKTANDTIAGPLIGNQISLFIWNNKEWTRGEYRKEATETAQRLIRRIKTEFKMEPVVGIGPLSFEFQQLQESYFLSLMAAISGGPAQFCFYDQTAEEAEKPEDRIASYRRLMESLENGDAETAMCALQFLHGLPENKQKQAIIELGALIDWRVYELGVGVETAELDAGLSNETLLHQLTMNIRNICRFVAEERTGKNAGRLVERAQKFIKENYMKELTLEQVAEEVNLNPYYFSKLFKQETGETFIDYVTGIRIDRAKKLMSDPRLSLKEVCFSVGYRDPAYFTRVFKKMVGVTPSEYRVIRR